jgi:hypothetical protein
MEDDNRAGLGMPQNEASRDGGRGDGSIEGVDGPQRTAVPVPPQDIEHLSRVPSRARARPLHRTMAGEYLIRLQEISLERTRAQPNARPVTHEMIAKLMALGHESADEPLLAVHALANEEKRGPNTVAAQLRQDQRCGSWIRAIVDRQGHQWRLGRHSVQAARIPRREMAYEPLGDGPEQSASGSHKHAHHSKPDALRPSHLLSVRLSVQRSANQPQATRENLWSAALHRRTGSERSRVPSAFCRLHQRGRRRPR